MNSHHGNSRLWLSIAGGIITGIVLLSLSVVQSSALNDFTTYYPLIVRQPTPTVMPRIEILSNHFHYTTDWDSLHILGEIRNESNVNLKNVQISLKLLDDRGRTVATEKEPVYVEYLKKNEKTCFHLIFLDKSDWGSWDTYEFTEVAFSPTGDILPDLTLISSSSDYDDDTGEFEISGSARNDAGVTVYMGKAVATLYNDDNKVVGCDYEYLETSYWYANYTKNFTFVFYDRDYEDVDGYRVQLDGVIP